MNSPGKDVPIIVHMGRRGVSLSKNAALPRTGSSPYDCGRRVSTLDAIFDHRLDFDPAGELDAFLKQAPAKWVVYLFTDADDQPIQLLCVKNLRASIKRRLGGDELIGPSRKVNYREVVRRIYWRRVDSAFEADLV